MRQYAAVTGNDYTLPQTDIAAWSLFAPTRIRIITAMTLVVALVVGCAAADFEPVVDCRGVSDRVCDVVVAQALAANPSAQARSARLGPFQACRPRRTCPAPRLPEPCFVRASATIETNNEDIVVNVSGRTDAPGGAGLETALWEAEYSESPNWQEGVGEVC